VSKLRHYVTPKIVVFSAPEMGDFVKNFDILQLYGKGDFRKNNDNSKN